MTGDKDDAKSTQIGPNFSSHFPSPSLSQFEGCPGLQISDANELVKKNYFGGSNTWRMSGHNKNPEIHFWTGFEEIFIWYIFIFFKKPPKMSDLALVLFPTKKYNYPTIFQLFCVPFPLGRMPYTGVAQAPRMKTRWV